MQGEEIMLKTHGEKGYFLFNSNQYLEDIQKNVASKKQEQADRNKENREHERVPGN